jgi:FkbM family methyltransferase
MRYYGVENMDKIVIEKYLNYDNGFFIEVGGNDGLTQSNTAHLEFFKNWTGILVEPISEKFDRMKINRTNSFCFNECLSDVDDQIVEFYDVNLMSMVKSSRKTSENDEHWLTEGEKCQNIKRKKYELKTKRLDTLLKKVNHNKIDFFSLDVEGYELSVLKGLNINENRPKYILIECTHKDEIFDFMEKNGYQNIDKFVVHDYLFIDKKQSNG